MIGIIRYAHPLTLATPEQYFQVAETVPDLPVLQGEAPSLWPYLEPLNTQMVPLDLPAVNGLMRAETYTSFACLLGLRTYPAEAFGQVWRRLLEGMDHNYPATGADDTAVRKRAYRTQAIDFAQWTSEESLRHIAERVCIPSFPGVEAREVLPVTVFNPLAWDRRDVASAHVTYQGDLHAMEVGRYRRIRLVDDRGSEVPFQQVDIREGVCREDTLLFVADVPSMGYRTYYVIPEGTRPGSGFGPNAADSGATPHAHPPVVTRDGDVFRWGPYAVRVDANTGEITVTGTDGHPLLDRARLVALEEQPNNMTFRDTVTGRCFEHAVAAVELLENGPVRARIRIRGTILSSPVEQDLMLYADLDRIDLIDRLDWRDVHPLRVQQLFPTGLSEPCFEYGVPYGACRADQRLPDSGPMNPDELPEASWSRLRECIHWIDVRSPIQGRGLLVASDRRAFDIGSPTLACNLLRICRSNFEVHIGEAGLQRAWRGQLGASVARFSLHLHAGDWRQDRLHRRGWELNNPLACVPSLDAESPKPLPPRHSFIAELGADYVATAFKQAEDGDGFILRFFESTGAAGDALIRLTGALGGATAVQPCAAEWTDLLENRTAAVDAGEKVAVRPYEIRTVPLVMAFCSGPPKRPVSCLEIPASQQPVSPGRSLCGGECGAPAPRSSPLPGQSPLLHRRFASPGNSRRGLRGFSPHSGPGRSPARTPRTGRHAQQVASPP